MCYPQVTASLTIKLIGSASNGDIKYYEILLIISVVRLVQGRE